MSHKHPLIFFFLIFSVPKIYGISLHLKMTGGFSSLNPTPINSYLKGWEEAQKREALLQRWNFQSKGFKNFNLGADFNTEFLFEVGNNFGLAIESGYLYVELSKEENFVSIEKSSGTFHYIHPAKITALPLCLSGYYFHPLHKKLRLFLKAGAGPLWVRFVEREGNKKASEANFKYTFFQEARARGLAFRAGLGFRLEIDPNLSLILEGNFRKLQVKEFTHKEEGILKTLFSFEEYKERIEFWQFKFMLLEQEPEGENFRQVAKAALDLSGFSARIGFMVKF